MCFYIGVFDMASGCSSSRLSEDHNQKYRGHDQARSSNSTRTRVAFWIQTLRFEGKSVLRARFPAYTPSRDIDTWIYSFFSTIGAQLPNVKNLELFGFQHTSLCRADCHAFAEWIIQMSQLNSVQSLHLSRCEMPANVLTAIIRSFSGLRNVALTCVSCRAIAPNEAGFVRLSDMSSDSFPTST